MTVSMRVMSAGDGYKYLLKTVAAADGGCVRQGGVRIAVTASL